MGDICNISARQVDPNVPEYGALPHINGENIEAGTGRLLGIRTAAEDGMTSGKYLFDVGDVLYSKLRPYLRKVAVANMRGVCSADMYPIKVKSTILDSHFVANLLLSDEFTIYAEEESRRARMPKLNREQLFAWETLIPPLTEQHRVSEYLIRQFAYTYQLQQTSKSQLDYIHQLPATLLQQAFSGEV